MSKQPDAFEKMAHKAVTKYFSREGTDDADVHSLGTRLLRAQHRKVVRMVEQELKETTNEHWASENKKTSYMLALSTILAKLKAMEGGT